LDIKQDESVKFQMLEEMVQRHFGGVAVAMEHGFARKKPSDSYSIDAAGEFLILPALQTMRVAFFVKGGIRLKKLFGDPGSLSAWPRSCATFDDLSESLVNGDAEDAFSDNT
jgi:hypothetical protein